MAGGAAVEDRGDGDMDGIAVADVVADGGGAVCPGEPSAVVAAEDLVTLGGLDGAGVQATSPKAMPSPQPIDIRRKFPCLFPMSEVCQ